MVDAPCSGQSLVARGKESPGCFHPATINMNANRQRRILSNSVKTVRSGGYLIYMTCTYSLKENERNVDWLLKKNPEFESVSVNTISEYQSSYSTRHCYRMWPMGGEGAGGFVAVLKKTNAAESDARGTLDDLPIRWSS
jgi:16S rRNA C967 or C1407 C5-methylase (RsmB/RsmF family)